jgi:hypothetical protein
MNPKFNNNNLIKVPNQLKVKFMIRKKLFLKHY